MEGTTIRLSDIANQAGVSTATVSRVVNGTAYVEPGTRRKVENAMRALHYRPNLLARVRRRGIPIVVANARMSERSAAGYARIRPLVRRMLGRVGLVVARSQADADRFAACGAPQETFRSAIAGGCVEGHLRDNSQVDGQPALQLPFER